MRHPWRVFLLLPAVRAAALLAGGIALQWELAPGSGRLLVAGLALLAAASALSLAERRRPALRMPRDVALALLFVCIGMLRGAQVLEDMPRGLLPYADRKEKLLLRGVLAVDPRVGSGSQRFLLDAAQVIAGADSYAVSGRVLCRYGVSDYVPGDTLQRLRAGDRVELRCRLRVPRPPRNPGGFDTRRWVLTEGAVLQASVSRGTDLRLLHRGEASFATRLLSEVRASMHAIIASLFVPAHAAVMNGLLLGDRSGIDEETLTDFRRAGIMHILAVSGLHAGIVLSLFFLPLERTPFPLRAALSLAALWGYAAVTGFAPPVTRAALMATLLLGGTLVQRPGSSVNALAVAAAAILLADPLALLGLSFQLSFGAVLGILLFHDRIQRTLSGLVPRRLRGRLSDAVLALLALTLAAQSLTLPLLAGSFGEISVAGLLTNLIAVPLVFVVVSCGLLAVLAAPLCAAVADLLAATAAGALDLVVLSSDLLSALPFAVIAVPALPALAWILYVSIVVYLSATPGRMRQKLVIVVLLIAAATAAGALAPPPAPERLRVTFFDVGQGDAILVEIPGQPPWLIDAGPGDERGNSGSMVILPALRAAGIDRLGALVVTHPDNDHAGGAPAVLRGVRVDSLFVSCTWPEHGDAGAVLAAARERGTGKRTLHAGERFRAGETAHLYVLSPSDGGCEPSNDNSLVLLLIYGKTRFLFTGDAEAEAERRMVARYDAFLRADVLKVGHHGSTTSTSPAFAMKVKPRHAVISVGRNNRFNHPREEILTRLRLVGAKIHRTDLDGAIGFESDGRKVWRMRN